MFSVISSGCINETKIATPGKSNSPTISSSSQTITQEKTDVVLRLIGPNGEEKALTLEDIKKLPQFEGKGGLKTKAGSIKAVGTYKGVLLTDLLKLVNGLSPDYNYIITAADGYSVTVSYDFVLGKGIDTMDENGNPVKGSVVPIIA